MSALDKTQFTVKSGTFVLTFMSIFSNNINLTFGLEVSPISLAFLFLALIYNVHIILALNNIKVMLWLVTVTFFATIPFTNPIDLIKDIVFFVAIILGFIISINEKYFLKTLQVVTVTISIVMVLQFSPTYMDIHNIIFNRASMMIGRGYTSLFAEPSFLAATTTIILLNYCILKGKLYYKDPIVILNVTALLLSLSSMAIFGLIFVFWKIRFTVFIKLVIISLFAFFFLPFILQLNVRMIQLALMISSGEALDVSASSRLFYILKDLQVLLNGLAFPWWGPGGYSDAMLHMNDMQIPDEFIYDPNMSGSLLGRYLICFGFIVLFIPILIIHKTSKRKFLEVILYLILVTLILLQMIPTGLVPFHIFLGSFFALLLRFRREDSVMPFHKA